MITDIERLAGVEGALLMLGHMLESDSRLNQTSSDLSEFINGMAEDVAAVIQNLRKMAS